MPLNIKYNPWVAKDRMFSNSDFFIPSLTSTLLYSKLVQILIVSLRDILKKSDSTSRLATKNLQSRFTISSVKAKKSFKVSSLNVIEKSLGTKNFASF